MSKEILEKPVPSFTWDELELAHEANGVPPRDQLGGFTAEEYAARYKVNRVVAKDRIRRLRGKKVIRRIGTVLGALQPDGTVYYIAVYDLVRSTVASLKQQDTAKPVPFAWDEFDKQLRPEAWRVVSRDQLGGFTKAEFAAKYDISLKAAEKHIGLMVREKAAQRIGTAYAGVLREDGLRSPVAVYDLVKGWEALVPRLVRATWLHKERK